MADIHIELCPLDKMILNGIEIKLGMRKQDVIALLGESEYRSSDFREGDEKQYYFDQKLILGYDPGNKFEMITVLKANGEVPLKPVIYGLSAFEIKMEEMLSGETYRRIPGRRYASY